MKKGIIIALILMSIGFASIATVLTINGTINYGYDDNDFDVIFSEAILDGDVKSEELIEQTNKKSITFETNDLSTLGDRSILEYQVLNNSKQYDAKVAIECERVDAEGNTAQLQESEYTTITPSPKELIVKAQESRKGTITVELKKVSTKELEEKFKCSLTVNPSEREEEPNKYIADTSCSSVAKPNLGDGTKLIPVTINEKGTITKISEDNDQWYNYCEKKWANAVILNDNEDEPSDGETIDISKIESMFVWIPKYKYRLWNIGVEHPLYTVHSIEIVFDTEDTTEQDGLSCATPGISGDTGSCDNGEYMTHPAFTSFGVEGFWIGKFETGYKDAQNKAGAEVDSADSNKIIIKPNVYSWRNIKVKNIYEASKNYESALNSHMLKNTEWGAVAYLSHSIFGINKEVTINNNSAYRTGHAALPTTDQSKYTGESGDGELFNSEWNTSNGFTASTTGNITGVYDMRGGAWEYVAAYAFEPETDNSEFTKEELRAIDPKYLDVYDKTSVYNSYNKMILGDATGEMGPFSFYADADNTQRWHTSWYGEFASFVKTSSPWFARGGIYNDGVISGLFIFTNHTGANYGGHGFRLALAPSKKSA